MLPFTNTIKGKIVIYTYLALVVFVAVLLGMFTKLRYDGLTRNAETILRLEADDIAENLNHINLEAVTIAKTLAKAQESIGIYGKRNRSIHLLKHVLEENPEYTGIYYCFEPNADGEDANYLQRRFAFLEAVDDNGRFLPNWIRSHENPDSLILTQGLHMDSSLYYHGVKVRIQSGYLENFIPPTLDISKHYSDDFDHHAFHEQHKHMITEPYLYEGKYMVEYTYPIMMDNEFKGIAGIDRTLESFDVYVNSLRRSFHEDIIIVSRLGRVISTTLKTLEPARPFDGSTYEEIIARMYTRVLNDTGMVFRATDPIDGEDYYFTGIKINMGHWLVISRVSEEEILAPIRSQIAITVIVAIMGLAALLPLFMWIANSISRPIKQAQAVADNIAEGRLDAPIPPHDPDADTGRLLGALAVMAGNLRKLVDFKEIAASFSARFVNVDSQNIDKVIQETLSFVGNSIGADRAYIMEYSAADETITYTHRWMKSDEPSQVSLGTPYSRSLIPYTMNRLVRGNIVNIPSTHDMPAEAGEEKEMLIRTGVKSYIMAPLSYGGRCEGGILFATMREQHIWERRHEDLLEILANVFVNASNRVRREREIHHLNEELERRIEHRTEQLQQANRELEAFSYSVSHDLRTPLRHIDGFTDLLRQRIESTLDEKDRQYLEKIANASKHMGRLIDDLLLFSRMARIDIVKTLFDTGEIVSEVIQELSPDYKGRNIEFNIEELPTMYGDPSMIRMVFVNLIANAIKFTEPRNPARITVDGEAVDGQITITVKDNGVGFDPSYGHKLFGVFERLHSQSEFEGTGIGLANVRRIIVRHDGTVSAIGEINQGATFSFTIPASPEVPDDKAT